MEEVKRRLQTDEEVARKLKQAKPNPEEISELDLEPVVERTLDRLMQDLLDRKIVDPETAFEVDNNFVITSDNSSYRTGNKDLRKKKNRKKLGSAISGIVEKPLKNFFPASEAKNYAKQIGSLFSSIWIDSRINQDNIRNITLKNKE